MWSRAQWCARTWRPNVKTKTDTKAKGTKPTPRPKAANAPSEGTSERFKALVAGTAKEPPATDDVAAQPDAPEAVMPAAKPARGRKPKAAPAQTPAPEPAEPLG